MIRKLAVASLVVVALACSHSSSTDPSSPGALKLAIASGNHQIVLASRQALGDPVVGQMVRLPNGRIAFKWIDLVAPRTLGAQTVVTGSPIPGAVVCAVSVDTLHPLVPFTPCTNTDAAGKATFFFKSGTIAGESRAQIRGTLTENGIASPAVFDTAIATVLPDTLVGSFAQTRTALGTLAIGDTVFLAKELTNVKDQYSNLTTSWSAKYAFSTDSIVSLSTAPALTGVGQKPVVTAGARVLYVRVGGSMIAFTLVAK